jgi:hypothetical protein
MHNLSFYESFYYNIIISKLEENNIILLIIDNYVNIIVLLVHYIKKFNLNLYIVSHNINIYNKLIDDINGEELEKNIKIFLKLTDINNIIFNKIFLFHTYSIKYLNKILSLLYDKININTLIFIYSSLANENNTKTLYKNLIREKININLGYKMGFLIPYTDFINLFDNNSEYLLNSIKIYKKNNYFLYGNNSVYETILRLNNKKKL